MTEYIQMTEDTMQDKTLWPHWLREAASKEPMESGALWEVGNNIYQFSIDDDKIVAIHKNDYIVKLTNDNLRVCSPGIFEQTYKETEQ